LRSGSAAEPACNRSDHTASVISWSFRTPALRHLRPAAAESPSVITDQGTIRQSEFARSGPPTLHPSRTARPGDRGAQGEGQPPVPTPQPDLPGAGASPPDARPTYEGEVVGRERQTIGTSNGPRPNPFGPVPSAGSTWPNGAGASTSRVAISHRGDAVARLDPSLDGSAACARPRR
jgi:hypothetical protein